MIIIGAYSIYTVHNYKYVNQKDTRKTVLKFVQHQVSERCIFGDDMHDGIPLLSQWIKNDRGFLSFFIMPKSTQSNREEKMAKSLNFY